MGIKTWKTTNGQIAFVNGILVELTGADALAQRLENRLKLWLGEWFLDTSIGVDWLDILESKPTDTDEIERILREEILKDAAVTEIVDFSVVFDNTNRRATITFSANGDVGLVQGEVTI